MKKALLLVSLLSGCGFATSGQLRSRASVDMRCPESQVTIKSIDSRTSAAYGCAKQAVYTESCQSNYWAPTGQSCTWIANAPTQAERVNP